MNKQTLVEEVTKQLDMSKAKSEECINILLDSIKKIVKKHGKLQLVGFGTFAVKKRAARMGFNPQTGQKIKIKASKTCGFKAGKAFKESL